jgi:Protein of unknown function (DUF2934)
MKDVADIIPADTTGEWEMGKYTGRRTSPTHDEIAQLAFSLYESRGRQDGHHIEDWLRAGQELVRHYA